MTKPISITRGKPFHYAKVDTHRMNRLALFIETFFITLVHLEKPKFQSSISIRVFNQFFSLFSQYLLHPYNLRWKVNQMELESGLIVSCIFFEDYLIDQGEGSVEQ